MDNPPSPYSDAHQSGQTGQAQESEMLYDYPHVADFPQPNYPPTQPMYMPTQPGYPAVGQPDYAAYGGYADAQQAGYYPSARRNWNTLWIILTSLALLLLIAAGSLYYYFQVRSTPARTLQAYCSAIKDDDGQALYNTYSSEAQALTDAPHLQQGLRLIEFLSGGIEDCDVDSASIRENDPQATARVTFTLANGRVNSTFLRLIKEHGQWKVENNATFP